MSTPSTPSTENTPGAPSPTRSEPHRHASGRVDRLTWGLAAANLVAQIGIIVTGGAVRLTGSGLGCSTWPLCEPGSFTPVWHAEMGIHPLIEFGNRTLTGVLTVIALGLLLAVYRREPTRSRPDSLKRLAWWPLVGIAIQAVVGGISVLITLHPLLVGFHMLLSLALVAFSTYLLVRLAAPDAPARPVGTGMLRVAPYALAVLGGLMSVLGTFVTGTGPLSGDASEILRLGFDHEVITRLHAVTVWLFVAVTVASFILVRRGLRAAHADVALMELHRALLGLLTICLITALVGYTQYVTGLPALMVGLHMLGAALVAAGTALVCSRFWTRGTSSVDPAPQAATLPAAAQR